MGSFPDVAPEQEGNESDCQNKRDRWRQVEVHKFYEVASRVAGGYQVSEDREQVTSRGWRLNQRITAHVEAL